MKGLFSCALVMVILGAMSAGASDGEQVMFYKAPPFQGHVVHASHHRAAPTRPAPEPEQPLFEQFLDWLKAHPAANP